MKPIVKPILKEPKSKPKKEEKSLIKFYDIMGRSIKSLVKSN